MSVLSQRLVQTAVSMIDRFGSDYALNGGATVKAVELTNINTFMERGLIQNGQRMYALYAAIVVGDLINVDSEDLYVSSAENKRLDNDLILSFAVVDK